MRRIALAVLLLSGTAAADSSSIVFRDAFGSAVTAAATSAPMPNAGQQSHMLTVVAPGATGTVSGFLVRLEASFDNAVWVPISADVTATVWTGSTSYVLAKAGGVWPLIRVHVVTPAAGQPLRCYYTGHQQGISAFQISQDRLVPYPVGSTPPPNFPPLGQWAFATYDVDNNLGGTATACHASLTGTNTKLTFLKPIDQANCFLFAANVDRRDTWYLNLQSVLGIDPAQAWTLTAKLHAIMPNPTDSNNTYLSRYTAIAALGTPTGPNAPPITYCGTINFGDGHALTAQPFAVTSGAGAFSNWAAESYPVVNGVGGSADPMWYRIIFDGSTYTCKYSLDGANYFQVGTPEPKAAHGLGNAVTVGVATSIMKMGVSLDIYSFAVSQP